MTTTFDETRVRRVQPGVSGGGQFAVQSRPETAVSLAALSPQVRELVEADLARSGTPASPSAFERAQAAHTAAVERHAAARAELDRSGDLLAHAEERHENAHDTYRDAERALEAADKTLREAAAAQYAETAVADQVEVPGWGTFDRIEEPEQLPAQFDALRVQVGRGLTEQEAQHLAGLVGYGWATTGGEPLPTPEQDTPNSIVLYADSTKTRSLAQVDMFVDDLAALVADGSPVRKTDRMGAGTKGTRLVEGLGGLGQVHLFVRGPERTPAESSDTLQL
ncbi:hypothetical protein [Pseudactinotalea terrae]|uniref:hypothetical protein n=1 Tax=Pseudactinotalea terrae TaxID=1743262 RepID=UPI0012E29DAD|nr:hypothetical protein [Pseudactinotalea terrae]